jgi:hypothetical protein
MIQLKMLAMPATVVPVESVRENFIVNFPGAQFQAQEASMILMRKSGPLGHFWT